MIHVMAAMAEFEAKTISERTRNAPAAAKARVTRLGFRSARRHRNGPTPKQTSAMSAKVCSADADRRALEMKPLLDDLGRHGIVSFSAIARHLNTMQHEPPRGRAWFERLQQQPARRAA